MKFLICALLNMTSNKTNVSPNRQLFFSEQKNLPDATEAIPDEDKNAHLDALATASKESPLTLAATLEDTLQELDARSAEKETEEISHGRGELVATMTAMGATAEEKADALARYDEQFANSEEDLAKANERDKEGWVDKLTEGSVKVREQQYEGDLAVIDDNIASLSAAMTNVDGILVRNKEGVSTAERAFAEIKLGLEGEVKEMFGEKINYATLRDSGPEGLVGKLITVLEKRGKEAGMPLTPDMARDMARNQVTLFNQKVEQIKVKEQAVDVAKAVVVSTVERKGRIQVKIDSAHRQRKTIIADYQEDIDKIKNGSYVIEGMQGQTLNEVAQFLANQSFTQEESDLLHGYTEKSGEMVRELTREVAFNRIREKRNDLKDRLSGSEALVQVREGLLRTKVDMAEEKAKKAASEMSVSWKDIKGKTESEVKEAMTESITKNAKRARIPFTPTQINDMVTSGYLGVARASADYDAAKYALENDSTLIAHRKIVAQCSQEIQSLEEYLERVA